MGGENEGLGSFSSISHIRLYNNVHIRAKENYMKIDYVLLGLISMRPKISGYQLKAIINDSTGYFFQAHLSQIYPRLKKLTEEEKLVFEVLPQSGKPDQKLYTITKTGIEALNTWLEQPFVFEKQRTCFDNYILKFILMGHLDRKAIAKYLDSGIAYFSEELIELQQNNLQIETAFIKDMGRSSGEKHIELWGNVIGYIYSDVELKIEWLKKTRETYRD